MKGIYKLYGNTTALKDVSLSVEKGCFISLFGPNGAGKSTMLGILSTLIKPTKGNVKISNLYVQKDITEIRRKIGYVTHSRMLYENLSALENLKFLGLFYNINNLSEKCQELLQKVRLYERRNNLVKTFSSGMKQRLSIARALLHEPEIFLLDEPYNGLDYNGINLFSRVLESLKEKNYTIFLTTHNIEEGLEYSNRVIIINKGSVVLDSEEKYNKDEFKEIYKFVLSGKK